MAPHHHRTDVVFLRDIGLVFQNTVDPTGHGDTLGIHRRNWLPFGLLITIGVETALHPLVVKIPNA